jgi:hypothetical protein
MRIQARLRPIKFDLRGYKKELQRHLTEELKSAARAWLERIVLNGPLHDSKGGMPAWSGASAATFMELASKVSLTLGISPSAPSRISLGKSLGDGDLSIESSKGSYTFIYRTSLDHLIINESVNVNALEKGFHLERPGPYNFIGAGRETFNEFAGKVRLPNPFKFLKAGATITI